jgi:hypothetical protein
MQTIPKHSTTKIERRAELIPTSLSCFWYPYMPPVTIVVSFLQSSAWALYICLTEFNVKYDNPFAFWVDDREPAGLVRYCIGDSSRVRQTSSRSAPRRSVFAVTIGSVRTSSDYGRSSECFANVSIQAIKSDLRNTLCLRVNVES